MPRIIAGGEAERSAARFAGLALRLGGRLPCGVSEACPGGSCGRNSGLCWCTVAFDDGFAPTSGGENSARVLVDKFLRDTSWTEVAFL